jgi:hypothetical protein
MTTRLLAPLAALAVVAGGPAVALAHARPEATAARTKAEVYRATLKPLRADIRNYTDLRGRAKLVARHRRVRITVTAHGLVPRRTYRWAITIRRCAGPRLKHFTYRPLRADRHGDARATGRSRRFHARTRPLRYVVVYQRHTHRPLICGRLRRVR